MAALLLDRKTLEFYKVSSMVCFLKEIMCKFLRVLFVSASVSHQTNLVFVFILKIVGW